MSNNPNLSVDPKQLDKASIVLSDPAETLQKALSHFDASVIPLGPHPWGEDDDIAMMMTAPKGYLENARLVLQVLDQLTAGILGLGAKVGKMKQDFVSAEEANSS
jgi:hypothetical protein